VKNKCGVRNAECGMYRTVVEPDVQVRGSNVVLQFRIPHSAFRIRWGREG